MGECEAVRSALTALEVDGSRELPPSLAAHCASCPECQRYLAEMEQLQLKIRRTAAIAPPSGFLEHLATIPERHRAMVRARRRVLAPAIIAIAVAAPLASLDTLLWLSSVMTCAGAFVAMAGMARARVLLD